MSERPTWLTEAARPRTGPSHASDPSDPAGSSDAREPSRRAGSLLPGGAAATSERVRPSASSRRRRLPWRRRPWRGATPGAAARPGPTPGLSSSRARFERRASAVRRRPRLVLAVVAAAVVAAGLLVWLVGYSPVLVTRTVTVTGLTDPGEQAAVVAAAAVPVGTPLARVDGAGATARVAAIPTIASVSVSRSWPSTVVVSVQRKVAVLAVTNPQGQLQVVDATGEPFEVVQSLPPGVTRVNATTDAPDPEGVRAAISVLQVLSPQRRASVSEVTVSTADLVTFKLGPVTVVWGGAADGATKVKVLEALLATNPSVVDVSAPDTPVTR